VETPLTPSVTLWLVFFLRPYPWSAASLSRVGYRGKDRPRKSLARVSGVNGRNAGNESDREREREGGRERARFASYFYDWPPHKHSLSYGLFALLKLGFRGALSAIHHPTCPPNALPRIASNRSPLSLSLCFFSVPLSPFFELDACAPRGLLQMMARNMLLCADERRIAHHRVH